MPDEPTPTPAGGTDGGAADAAAASSQQQSDAALLASLEQGKETAPDPDAEFWKQAAEKDFSKAPDDIRAKIEAPFLSVNSKKVQDVEQKYQQRLDQLVGAVDRIIARDGTPPNQPNIREELRQKIAEGDFTAVEGLVDQVFHDKYGAQMNFITSQQAISNAASLLANNQGPDLAQYSNPVGEILQKDKDLAYLAMVNNGQYGPRVLAGLAYQLGYNDLKKENATLKASIETEKKQAVEKYKAELRGLPRSTSKAGTTPTAFTQGKTSGFTDKELLAMTLADMGVEQ